MSTPSEQPAKWSGPASSASPLTRFFGGPPLSVIFRLVLLSILIGVILKVMGLDPFNILRSIQDLFQYIWDMGFDAVRWLWRYFLLGAVLVVPIWLIMRLLRAAKRP
jgi:hypothetical protein